MRPGRSVIPLLLSSLLILSACGSLDPAHLRSPSRVAEDRAASARQNIRQQLAADNYRAALALVRQEVQGNLPEAALAEEYERALNGLLRQAEQYREKGVPEKAGPLYRAALEAFPERPPVAERAALPAAEIAARIETCAGELMERGLVAYRSGDLDRAIGTWKMVRAFDPRHQASQKALKTAEVQRANLEKVQAEK